jgi:hypothetical protein
MLTAPLTAGQTWLKTNPSGTLPSAVQGTISTLFDPITNSLIAFGGGTGNPSDEVWVLSGANGLGTNPSWTQLKPTGSGLGQDMTKLHSMIRAPIDWSSLEASAQHILTLTTMCGF